MWTFDNASALGVSDMDRRDCPSYEAVFDACDPLGSVLECSGRGPARVLRRRCRSEGVDRSPYEDVPMHRSADAISRQHRALTNKSHFTLNNAIEAHFDRFQRECFPAAENGDYIMAHDQKRRGSQPNRIKINRTSPNRPLLVTTLSNTKVEEHRLPKVEELFEKVDHDMIEVPKQPLKSILNNPLPKTPQQGILKKPKHRPHPDTGAVHREPKLMSPESRRRQRACSESDNLYSNFHFAVIGADKAMNKNMKRAKDNSGIGYSYGTALATLANQKINSANNYKLQKSKEHPALSQPMTVQPKEELHNSEPLMKNAVINNDSFDDEVILGVPRQDPTCPLVSPALPVNSVTSAPVPTKKLKPPKKKSKTKPKTMKVKTKVEANTMEVDGGDESPSLDAVDTWTMETDALMVEIAKLESNPKHPITPAVQVPVHKLLRKDEPQEVPKVLKANVAPIQPVTVSIPSSDTARKNLTKDKQDPFLTALHTTDPFKFVPSRKDSPMKVPDSVLSCVRQSLFPRVPPYLKFIGLDDVPILKVPMPIQKHLKWKLTTITPIVVKKTLVNSGFRLVKSDCDTAECPQEETIDWIGIWGKHMKSLMFRAIKDGQKMNHFPGTFQIGRKDRLWRNLQKLAAKHGMKEFGIMPKTYVLPHDLKLLKQDWDKHAENNEKWIIKPPASARGTGIKVVSRWTQIPKKRAVVVQRYVSKPYLINGSKFDLRLYVLITSVHPLRIYLYKDGLARFASVKYNNEISSLNDRYMHLTNYSINRLSKNYTPNEDYSACEGHKWTLQTLFQYLKTDRGVDTRSLWESMKDLVIKTIISGEASISSLTKANVTSRYNCYELFGIDVLLDEDLKPWLLEVNISPSLHSASPLDIHVKGPMVTTVLNIAQFQIPTKTNLDMLVREKPHKLNGLPYDSRLYTIYLSKEERDKHIIYTNMDDRDLYLRDILSTLTPDDVRHLIQAEDELTQAGDMERVFPTHDTHKYLNFLSGPRYYNRLFDAWETRYTANRESGIDLLRNLCDIGYHLEVPPVPLKARTGVSVFHTTWSTQRAAPQLSALDRCRMMWTRRHRLLRSGLQFLPSHRWSPRSPRAPFPARPASAATFSRSRLSRRPLNRVHSATPQSLRATAEESSNNVHMDTTIESRKKCTTSADNTCTETLMDLNRNVQCAETSETVAQKAS
ncbi:tubulin polyglutamylase TTLL4-like isoform X3 [Hyposmocoma kahamanoa]|uniref:tubulin polyglutamylase TTLL4-like isoform X3 n=1 Tax=Hyposmocoma kahamanoa TaxID=1477025 RepID=UPI000E6D5F34|nr:tubulin polyglutamylase TTLL4-like isoform X3 [Hyposmocoma kahamanoa]